MIVLHCHWQLAAGEDQHQAVLWAETSDIAQPTPPDRRRKQAAPHPFVAAPGAVLRGLGAIGLAPDLFRPVTFDLLLPTTRTGPRPSPQLLHEWELADDKVSLGRWRIEGLWLTPSAAFDLLQSLPAPSELPPTLRLGADCRFWLLAARFVQEALAKQKVLPVLERATEKAQGAAFVARWRPVLDGAQDGPRLASLRVGMPPLCRAETTAPDQAPAAAQLLDSFFNTLTDTLFRRWATGSTPYYFPQDTGLEFAWIRALFAPADGEAVGRIQGAVQPLERLANSHRAWLRNLTVAGDRHYRIGFRLEAPAQQEQATRDWRLHFLLQSREDPSLLLPADEIWKGHSAVLQALAHPPEQPQEKLLAGLGYAARLYPTLARSLQGATPSATELDTDEAFGFLRESAPLLEQSGFAILTPPWWNQPGSRLGIRLRLGNQSKLSADVVGKSNLTLDSLVHYQWEVALGETPLTREEFQALVALKSPLVQIRGQWVQLDTAQIDAALKFWQKVDAEGDLSLGEATRFALGAEQVQGLQLNQVAAEGEFAAWLEQLTGRTRLDLLDPPDDLRATLRPYQLYGYSWLSFLNRFGLGACLADDMGLGKTIQTLAFLLQTKAALGGQLPGPVLLVCPTSVVTNWAREVDRFTPGLTSFIHQGMDRLRGDELLAAVARHDLVLTSYPLVRRDAETLGQVQWLGVILDEAQNIKNSETKQARTIRQLRTGFRLALTGTPVENRLSELWSIMHFLNPGYLGSRERFRQRYALPIERYDDAQAAQQLRKLVAPFILRRVKSDPSVISDLPEKQETKIFCHLTEEQATLYQAVVQDALHQIESAADDFARKGLVLTMLMKLKQICNHPAQYLHQIHDGAGLHSQDRRSGKLLRLVEILEEIVAVEDRVLIFTQYAEMGHLLRSYLQQQAGAATQFLHGGTPTRQRTAMIERFQEDPAGPPIFILSLKAGGVGLNLTRANHVVHFDRWWNPAVEDQATHRAFRIGQQRNVQVHKFVCVGTLEEKIDQMIDSKRALANSIIGSGEDWLTAMNTADLRDLVSLRRSALAEEA